MELKEILRAAYRAFYDMPMKTEIMFDAIDAASHAMTTNNGVEQAAFLFYGTYRKQAWTNDQTLVLNSLARALGLE